MISVQLFEFLGESLEKQATLGPRSVPSFMRTMTSFNDPGKYSCIIDYEEFKIFKSTRGTPVHTIVGMLLDNGKLMYPVSNLPVYVANALSLDQNYVMKDAFEADTRAIFNGEDVFSRFYGPPTSRFDNASRVSKLIINGRENYSIYMNDGNYFWCRAYETWVDDDLSRLSQGLLEPFFNRSPGFKSHNLTALNFGGRS